MKYELVYILTPKLSDPDADKKSKEINEIVKNEAEEIILEDFWGKKQLAYPIEKLDHGYYVLVQFKAEKASIAKIEKQFKLDPEIIRYLIVKRDVLAPMGEEVAKKTEATKATEVPEVTKETEAAKEKEVAEVAEKVEETNEKTVVAEPQKKAEAPKKEDVLKEEISEIKVAKKAVKAEKADASDLDKKLDDILNEDLE